VEQFQIKTGRRVEFLDVTERVQAAVKKSGIKSGVCNVFVPHTTAGVTINENADPNVIRDIIKELDKIVPLDDNYTHGEGNSAAHIKSSLMGCAQQVLIENGRLVLGTWQSIFFCEFDGPRSRDIWVKVMGE
jgi:secondary thiamine-phosphate synthase enzyme